jgi:uncharacterized membrane protein YdjX (TVP38/TMEM64 family)
MIEGVAAATAALESDLIVAALVFLGTTMLVLLCIPGVLVPMAVSSGSLIGGWAVPVVALGALVGSQILFVGIRRADAGRLRAKVGSRLARFEQRFARYGLWYVVVLRLIGAPHFLVTASSAMLPLRAGSFAIATLAGFLPVIALAAVAGSAFL